MPELPNRLQIDADLAARLTTEFDRQRPRLERLLGDPPDASKVPQAFWDQLAAGMYAALLHDLQESYVAAATQQADLLNHPLDEQQLTADALAWALEHVNETVAGFIARSKTMVTDKVAEYQAEEQKRKAAIAALLLLVGTPGGIWEGERRRLSLPGTEKPTEAERVVSAEELAAERNKQEAERRDWMGRYLDPVFSPGRADAVAITSVTRANTVGEQQVVRQYRDRNPTARIVAYWVTEHDSKVCPLCQALDGLPEGQWGPAAAQGPPRHRNCRCSLVFRPKLVPLGKRFAGAVNRVLRMIPLPLVKGAPHATPAGLVMGYEETLAMLPMFSRQGETEGEMIDRFHRETGMRPDAEALEEWRRRYGALEGKAYNPNEPRIPSGPEAGEWTSGGSGAATAVAPSAPKIEPAQQPMPPSTSDGARSAAVPQAERKPTLERIEKSPRWGTDKPEISPAERAAFLADGDLSHLTGTAGKLAAAAFAEKHGGVAIAKSEALSDAFEKTRQAAASIGELKMKLPGANGTMHDVAVTVPDAVHDYTTDDYADFNEALRDGEPLHYELQGKLNAINKLVDTVGKWKQPATVFHGVQSTSPEKRAAFLDRVQKCIDSKGVWVEKGILSTSANERISRDWIKDAAGGGVLMRIRANRGAAISSMSMLPEQEEVIEKPGSKFKPTGIKQEGGVTVVDFEQID